MWLTICSSMMNSVDRVGSGVGCRHDGAVLTLPPAVCDEPGSRRRETLLRRRRIVCDLTICYVLLLVAALRRPLQFKLDPSPALPSHLSMTPRSLLRLVRIAVVVVLPVAVSGCGVLAAPCRVGSAVIKMVPVVGHAAALPTDACAAVIDP